MTKRRPSIKVHTRIEYQYNSATQTYEEISDEFYLYDGPLAEAGGAPTKEVGDQAFYEDGTESGAVIIGTKNTNVTLDVDTIYHIRYALAETAGNKWTNASVQLRSNHEGGGALDVNATSSVVQSAGTGSGLTENADTTQRLALQGGAFVAYQGQDEVDGITNDTVDPKSQSFEVVFAFTIISGHVLDAETIVLDIVDGSSALAFDVNPTYLTITVNKSTGTAFTKTNTGSLTGSGGPAKKTSRTILGSLTGSGIVTTATAYARAVVGSLIATGIVAKKTARIVLGSITGTGAITTVKKLIKLVTGSITASGSVAKKTIITLSSTLTSSGTLSKKTSRLLASTITLTGSAYKKMSLLLIGSLTAAGDVAAKIVFTRLVSGSITLAGVITKGISRRLEASISMAGVLIKRVPKLLSGSISATGALVRKTSRQVLATISLTGLLTPSFLSFKSLAGSITPSGVVSGIVVIITGVVYHAKRLYYRMLGRR